MTEDEIRQQRAEAGDPYSIVASEVLTDPGFIGDADYVSVSLTKQAREVLKKIKRHLGADTLSEAIMKMEKSKFPVAYVLPKSGASPFKETHILRFFKDSEKQGAAATFASDKEAHNEAKAWANHFGVLVQIRSISSPDTDDYTTVQPSTRVRPKPRITATPVGEGMFFSFTEGQ